LFFLQITLQNRSCGVPEYFMGYCTIQICNTDLAHANPTHGRTQRVGSVYFLSVDAKLAIFTT